MSYPRFSKDNVPTLQFTRADAWPRPQDGDEGQITSQSTGGLVRVATLRDPIEFITMSWTGRSAMPHGDYVALGAFLKHALIHFRSYPFTFTDVDDAVYLVRYWKGYYQFVRISTNLWQGTLTLRIESRAS